MASLTSDASGECRGGRPSVGDTLGRRLACSSILRRDACHRRVGLLGRHLPPRHGEHQGEHARAARLQVALVGVLRLELLDKPVEDVDIDPLVGELLDRLVAGREGG